jgi:hypothetical protein
VTREVYLSGSAKLGFERDEREQATAKATADPYGMTNKRASKD